MPLSEPANAAGDLLILLRFIALQISRNVTEAPRPLGPNARKGNRRGGPGLSPGLHPRRRVCAKVFARLSLSRWLVGAVLILFGRWVTMSRGRWMVRTDGPCRMMRRMLRTGGRDVVGRGMLFRPLCFGRMQCRRFPCLSGIRRPL